MNDKTDIHHAIDVLRHELKNNRVYYDVLKANIAMAFYDELRDDRSAGIYKISNNAADRFLKKLLLDNKIIVDNN